MRREQFLHLNKVHKNSPCLIMLRYFCLLCIYKLASKMIIENFSQMFGFLLSEIRCNIIEISAFGWTSNKIHFLLFTNRGLHANRPLAIEKKSSFKVFYTYIRVIDNFSLEIISPPDFILLILFLYHQID